MRGGRQFLMADVANTIGGTEIGSANRLQRLAGNLMFRTSQA